MEYIFHSIILGIVEGLTEFLPVSSTGHLLIVSEFLGDFGGNIEFSQVFNISIQCGALLAVIILYFRKFFPKTLAEWKQQYTLLFIGSFPVLLVGFLFHDSIKNFLFHTPIIAGMLLLGGIAMLALDTYLDQRAAKNVSVNKNNIFVLGLFQCLALIPGTSRSLATIYGGLSQGMSRKTATEWSFLLAVPALFSATAYSLLKSWQYINYETAEILSIGFIVSFVVAFGIIRWFLNYIIKHGFKLFAWYRIIIGIFLLLYWIVQ